MDCIDHLKKMYGENFSEDELVSMMEEAKKEEKAISDEGLTGRDFENEYQKRVGQKMANKKMKAAIKYRQTVLQHAKRAEAVDYILSNWKGDEAKGLQALLVGNHHTRAGSRGSVDQAQQSLKATYLAELQTRLQNLGPEAFKAFTKDVMNDDIARALWSIDNPKAQPYNGPQLAMKIAQEIHAVQERARIQANDAGAYIGKEPGYICRQSHDAYKLAAKGFDQWKKDVAPLLDWSTTGADGTGIAPADRENFLKEVYYNIVNGRVGKDTNELTSSTIGSDAHALSRQRILQFKDADSWLKYNADYGKGSVREAVADGLMKMAHSTALMERMGPASRANFDNIVKDIRKALHKDVEATRNFDKQYHKLENQYKEVSGETDVPASMGWAKWSRCIRALESMAKLGAAVVASLSDIPVAASEFAFQGKGFFRPMFEMISETCRGMKDLDKQRVLGSQGIFLDHFAGEIAQRFNANEGLPGFMAKLQQTYFRFNLLQWWTDAWRSSVGVMMARDLAIESTAGWKGLSAARKRVLGMYSIGENEFALLNSGKKVQYKGQDMFTPECVDTISEADLKAYAAKNGRKAPDAAKQKDAYDSFIRQEREALRSKFQSYYRDRITTAVLEPDARTKSFMNQGLQAGTPAGEAIRFAGQFKSFPMAFTHKVLGREIGRLDTIPMGTATSPTGQTQISYGESVGQVMMSIGRLIAMTTLFGAGAIICKDAIKGKSQKDWSDMGSDAKFVLRAFTQGGGAGIYADILLGQFAARGGSSFVDAFGGPLGSTANDLADIFTQIKSGEFDRAGNEALKTFVNHIPFNNLFYARTALDYALLYSLYDWSSPGYYRRLKQRNEDNGQEMWYTPLGI